MRSEIFQTESIPFEEENLYAGDIRAVGEKSLAAMSHAIENCYAVGVVSGYYDEKLSILSASRFFLKNLNYEFEEMMEKTGGSLLELIFEEDRALFSLARFIQVQERGECRMITKDGNLLDMQLYKEDSVDTDGRPIWVLAVRLNWESYNMTLVNSVIKSGSWYFDCDENSEITRVVWGRRFREMLGYHSVIDFPNKLSSWSDLLHPDDKEHTLHALMLALEDKTGFNKYNVEYRMKMRDGSYEWFRANAEVSRRIDGSARRIIGIFVNINAEKQAEIERQNYYSLRAKNEEMDQVIQSLIRLVNRFVICNLDTDTYQYYEMEHAETIFEKNGGYTNWVSHMAEYCIPQAADERLEDYLSVANLQSELKTTNDVIQFEYSMPGENKYKRMIVLPHAWKDGRLTHVLLVARDITAEKEAEIKSRQALKDAFDAATKASRAKTEFLANMSHDIRTPMNAIVGMTAIAGANIDQKEKVIDCLSTITQSSRHLLGLINEVLDMSRIESGNVSLTEEEFNLSELTDNLIAMVKDSLTAHHHQFEMHLRRIEHENVRGDSLRIQQVFTNIMSNAIKYTPDGGKILFSIEEKQTGHKDIGCYEFIVEDNGVGMSEDFLKVIFEPFTRVDDKRTSRIQGTGLGMAITQNIVSMMGGHIKVESKLGKGSRFIVDIFLKLQEEQNEKIKELTDLPVLVVDDDHVCCEGTVAILQDIGIKGEWVDSGIRAIERVKERHAYMNDYFAIIMDWQMPGMDGIEATRRIRKIVGHEVTIIVMSAYDYAEIEEEAKAAGVDAFITKPMFKSKISRALHDIVRGTHQRADTYLDGIRKSNYTGKRILLVEDNELNSEIAKEIIEMTGATVETVVDGQEAITRIEKVEDGYYSLVFMDIQMPKINGYQAATAIRAMEREWTGKLPIIAMTANAFTEDVVMAKAAGMNEHVAKPLDMNKLCEVLKRWM